MTTASEKGAQPSTKPPHTRGTVRRGVSLPWLAAFLLMVCFVWGNSLVPGDESGALSMGVVELVQGALAAVGLPCDWVTNFVVRKTAHFTEYLVLALVGMQAFRPHRAPFSAARVALAAVAILAVPCLDETIQLFVSGRAGQVRDVLIDCGGALTGALLTLLASRLRGRRSTDD